MAEIEINFASRVAADPGHVSAELGDGLTVLHLQSQQYHSLRGSAPKIWELIQHPVSVAKLVQQLVTLYDVDSTQCESETLTLLRQLHRKQLLHVVQD